MTDSNTQSNDGVASRSASPPKRVSEMMKLKSLDELLKMDREMEEERDAVHQWYHGSITREGAETLLKEGKRRLQNSDPKLEDTDGLFLIRQGVQKNFALSMMEKWNCYHYIIEERTECHFQIDKGPVVQGLEKVVELYSKSSHGLPHQLSRFCHCTTPPARARKTGHTNLLHRAVAERDESAVEKILDHKDCPCLDNKNENGSTALHVAAELGSAPITRLLLDHDADVTIKDVHDHTPLHRAAFYDHSNIIYVLAVHGKADPFAETSQKWTPLHEAAFKGNINSVKMLLDFKPCPHPRNSDSKTPLDLAMSYGRTECKKFLRTYTPPEVIQKVNVSYHSELDRDGAQKLLKEYEFLEGLYLIRKSTKGEDYRVLSHCRQGNVHNHVIQSKIYMDNKVYFIDTGPYFLSLPHLVYFYSRFSNAPDISLVAGLTTDGELVKIPIEDDYYNFSLETSPQKGQQQKPGLPPRDFPDHTKPSSPELNPPSKPPPSKADLTKTDSSKPELPKQAPPSRPKSVDVEQNIIKEKNLKIGSVLGEGEYGSVHKGILSGGTKLRPKKTEVAVKTFHADCVGNEEDFLREAKVMAGLDNPNIIKLLGVCHGKQLMLVEEFVAMGSMLDYLINHSSEIDVKKDLYLWAGQIAKGMEYLESKKLVHRDLAARNILLASKEQIKISDFGLSRLTSDYNDCYQATKGGRWPIKWYAPESVNYGKFTHASDVWSYGVTLWEMFSFGDSPYGEKKGIDVLEFIEKGGRLEKPDKCMENDYKIMKSCWMQDPKKRPTFNKLCSDFQKDPNYATVDFTKKGRLQALH